jgi:integrase/recombinase XerC
MFTNTLRLLTTRTGETMLTAYRHYLISRRRSSNTIRVRVLHMKAIQEVHPDLLKVTRIDLETYIQVHSAKWKPETINAVTSSVKTFYKWASPRFGIDNPSTEIEGVHVPRKRAAIASDVSIRAAIMAAPPHAQLMILLGAECGLRRMEIATLPTSARDGEWLTVTGKGEKTRTVHLNENLQHRLEAIEDAQGEGYYFPGRFGGHISDDWVYRLILRYLGKNPHSLRHRAGTTVYRGSGNDIRVAQDFLGHSTPVTTAKYVHTGLDDMRRASSASSLGIAA